MTRSSIGGVLDYAALAALHRPTDPRALAAEIRRLAGTGLKPRDIATALGLTPEFVLQSLNQEPQR